MIVRVERVVPFPRDAVYAWWTDFRPDDHPGRPSPATSAREVLRREGNEIWLRDHARRPAPVTVEERVVLDPPNGYAVTARYPAVDAHYEYRFEATGTGTRVLLLAHLRPHHVMRLLLRVFQGRVQRYAERDTDDHLRRMSEDLRGSRP
jgi:hypothetical protein